MTLLQQDISLREAFRRAEPGALERVYRHYLDEVARLVRLGFSSTREPIVTVPGIKSPEGQCDLIQEAFLRAFSKTSRENYDGAQPFRPYLLRIVKNLMIDELRRQSREAPAALEDEAAFDDFVIAAEDPREQVEEERRLEATRRFVSGLPQALREFYVLRYQQGLPQEEVARRLGSSRRKVRRQEETLRGMLEKFLMDEGLWEAA
ncbi:MAG: sigma-70 family RNA polymerase sigma factor [Myxococcales bacterium]|nr:sigma-70 family RNA polymerase sigma factor [Myxococcales bacterium]